jgi:hypothetical protein
VSVRNGTPTHAPSTDLLGSLGLPHPDLPEEPDHAPDTEMDARVAAVVARQRPPAPVTVRHVEPPAAAPVPPRTAAGRQRAAREDVQVAAWRREEIFEWLYAEGAKTIAEIKDRFELSQALARAAVDQLRVEGRLQRTGRERQGPRGGRPSAEFEAVEPAGVVGEPETPASALGAGGDEVDDDGRATTISEEIAYRRDNGLTIPAEPFPDREGATEETRRIGAEIDAELGRAYAEEDQDAAHAAPDGLTVHQELTVRYVASLIDWVSRTAYVRDDGPPEHVFDRIERLLGIEDGVA